MMRSMTSLRRPGSQASSDRQSDSTTSSALSQRSRSRTSLVSRVTRVLSPRGSPRGPKPSTGAPTVGGTTLTGAGGATAMGGVGEPSVEGASPTVAPLDSPRPAGTPQDLAPLDEEITVRFQS